MWGYVRDIQGAFGGVWDMLGCFHSIYRVFHLINAITFVIIVLMFFLFNLAFQPILRGREDGRLI